MATLREMETQLGEIIAQLLPPEAAMHVRRHDVVNIGHRVRLAMKGQGWAIEAGPTSRVDSEWLITVLKSVDDSRAILEQHPTEAQQALAWERLSSAVDRKYRGQG